MDRELEILERELVEDISTFDKVMAGVGLLVTVVPVLLLTIAPLLLGFLSRRRVKNVLKKAGAEIENFVVEAISKRPAFTNSDLVTGRGEEYVAANLYFNFDGEELVDRVIEAMGKDAEKVDRSKLKGRVYTAMMKLGENEGFHEKIYKLVLSKHGDKVREEVDHYVAELEDDMRSNPGLFWDWTPEDLLSFKEMESVTNEAFVGLAGRKARMKLWVSAYYPLRKDMIESYPLLDRIEALVEGDAIEEAEILDEGVFSKIQSMGGKVKDWFRKDANEAKVITALLSDRSMRSKLDRLGDSFMDRVEAEVSGWVDDQLSGMDFDRSELAGNIDEKLAKMMVGQFMSLTESEDADGQVLAESVEWDEPFTAGGQGGRKLHVQATLSNSREFKDVADTILKKLGHPDDAQGVGEEVTWENIGEAQPYSDDGWTWEGPRGDYVYIANNPPVVGGTIEMLRDLGLYQRK